MRSRLGPLGFALALAALVFAASPRPLARAEDPAKGDAFPYRYYPRGSEGTPELLDARTGAVYKRNDYSGKWELLTKPLKE